MASKQIQEAYIVAATRTPIGKAPRGMFRNTRPDDLLVAALQNALKQTPGLDLKAIEDVVIGCSFPEAEQGINMARAAAVIAGLPHSVGGITVNRFCASGISAVQMAADRIRVGEADVMIAGGAESMSMVPMGGNKPSFNPRVFENDENVGIAYGMGLTAEKVAEQWKVSREAQDAFALASHQKAVAAMKAGDFGAEMTPIEIVERLPNLQTGDVALKTRTVNLDEGARPETSIEGLAKLKPVFAAKGSVTAGNSSQTSDGAGALILASEAAVKRFDLRPIARFVSFAVRGVPPKIMGIGPIEAIPAALRSAGLKLDDIGWIELNEAFAAQALAVINSVGLDPAKVNPMGGAIALGHPLGATGAIRAATVIHGLRRKNLKYGMVTMCVGMGQGAAGIFETVNGSRRALMIAACAPLAACDGAPVQTFPTITVARSAIDGLRSGWKTTGAWPLAVVLNHAAQSIEYSLRGFPEPKSALFQATAGKAAFAWFEARGAMRHSLSEPIPGAPVLSADAALPPAIDRLQTAWTAFESHTGPLAPHFAYGALDKAQYTRAHLMHLANHWQELQRT